MNSATPCASPLHVLRVWVQGIGLLAPGIANWSQGQAVLSGSAPYVDTPTVLPMPEMLPSAERRRASRVIKLAMAVAAEAVQHAGQNAAELASVFTSSTGDGHNCHALCETLASSNREVSPTRFHNSVHNTAAGYWCIAAHATGPCQVMAAFDASFAAGLLEAVVQVVSEARAVLLVSYDADYPQPLYACRPVPDAAGLALVLCPARPDNALAQLDIQWQSGPATAAPLPDAALQQLNDSIPAMRALPLLRQLALATAGTVVVPGLDQQHLHITVTPCA